MNQVCVEDSSKQRNVGEKKRSEVRDLFANSCNSAAVTIEGSNQTDEWDRASRDVAGLATFIVKELFREVGDLMLALCQC